MVARVCRFPVRFGGSPASIRRLAPNLGEHNAEFLGELPVSEATSAASGGTAKAIS
jgi:crotonobetainyl-CoA:carnitine CoA-transferase CaiB-like acyl-CoA transferase